MPGTCCQRWANRSIPNDSPDEDALEPPGWPPMIQAAAQLTFALDRDAAGDFVATEVAAELRLERDAADAVMALALLALTLLQAGRCLHGTRL